MMSKELYNKRISAAWRWLLVLLGTGLTLQVPINTMVDDPGLLGRCNQARWLLGTGLVGSVYCFMANFIGLMQMSRGRPEDMVAMVRRDPPLQLRLLVLTAGTLGVILALLLGQELGRCLKIGAILAGGTLAVALIAHWGPSPPDRLE